MGSDARLRRAHLSRANCMNARCRAWMPAHRFPLCPSCRLMFWTGAGLMNGLLVILGGLWGLLTWWGS